MPVVSKVDWELCALPIGNTNVESGKLSTAMVAFFGFEAS